MRQLGLYDADKKHRRSLLHQRQRELKELRERQKPLVAAMRADQARRRALEAIAEANVLEARAQLKMAKFNAKEQRSLVVAVIQSRAERRIDEPVSRLPGALECYWCGLPYEPMNPPLRRTREHLLPRSLGGGNEPSNMAWSHWLCNTQRSSDTSWVPFSEHGQFGVRVPVDVRA